MCVGYENLNNYPLSQAFQFWSLAVCKDVASVLWITCKQWPAFSFRFCTLQAITKVGKVWEQGDRDNDTTYIQWRADLWPTESFLSANPKHSWWTCCWWTVHFWVVFFVIEYGVVLLVFSDDLVFQLLCSCLQRAVCRMVGPPLWHTRRKKTNNCLINVLPRPQSNIF